MTPKEILKSLSGVEYGAWVDKEKRKATDEEFDRDFFIYRNCSIAHPDELLKRKVGHCYDQSLYEWTKLKESGYNPILIYMENKTASHAAVIYEDKGRWYWIEHSWNKYRGIHGPYKSKVIAASHVFKTFSKDDNIPHPTYFNPNVDAEKILKLKNISIHDFMSICGSKEIQ